MALDRTEPVKPNDPATPPSLPGERRVPGTDASLAIDRPDTPIEGEGVTEPVAVDHRKQFTGADDHRDTEGPGR